VPNRTSHPNANWTARIPAPPVSRPNIPVRARASGARYRGYTGPVATIRNRRLPRAGIALRRFASTPMRLALGAPRPPKTERSSAPSLCVSDGTRESPLHLGRIRRPVRRTISLSGAYRKED
jgi:hypothetical protein